MNTCVIVITRFNLAIKDRYHNLSAKSSFDDCIWLDKNYLSKRFELFEQYTFPSFCAQTDTDFLWLVLFHKDTPKEFVNRIEEYQRSCSFFSPRYLDNEQSYELEYTVNRLLEDYKGQGRVITVRVDNDDAIHPRFIEGIKNGLNCYTETAVLSFRNGLQYDTRNGRCMRYSYVNNHFIAYLAVGDIRSNIFSFEHPDVDKYVKKKNKCVVDSGEPMWVEIVSGTNCINEIWCRPSKVFIPYSIKSYYPFIDLWSSRSQWIWYMISYLPVSFVKMFVDIIRLSVIFVREKREERGKI